jgi:hypothetical protein
MCCRPIARLGINATAVFSAQGVRYRILISPKSDGPQIRTDNGRESSSVSCSEDSQTNNAIYR